MCTYRSILLYVFWLWDSCLFVQLGYIVISPVHARLRQHTCVWSKGVFCAADRVFQRWIQQKLFGEDLCDLEWLYVSSGPAFLKIMLWCTTARKAPPSCKAGINSKGYRMQRFRLIKMFRYFRLYLANQWLCSNIYYIFCI